MKSTSLFFFFVLLALAASAVEVGAQPVDEIIKEWEVTVRLETPKTKVNASEKTNGAAGDEKEDAEKGDDPDAYSGTRLRFRATVIGFGKDGIRIRTPMAPDQELEFTASQLISVNRLGESEIPAKPNAEDKTGHKDGTEEEVPFVVALTDDGEFNGRLASLNSRETVLESEAFGPLKIPTAAIRSIARDGNAFAEPALPGVVSEIVAVLESGEVIRGKLGVDATDPTTITLAGAVARARFSLDEISRIDFPKMAGGESARESGRIEYEISLADGGRMVCSQVDLNEGHFGMAMRSGVELEVPLSRVESIFPVKSGGNRLGSGVLMWGGYSDIDEEYAHTKQAVEAGGLRIDEIPERLPGSDFRRRLQRSQAFLIPEMESFNPRMLDNEIEVSGRKMKLRDYFSTVMRPNLERFLAAGGHVVCTGMQTNHYEFLRLIGIEGIENATDRDGSEFKIPPEIQRKLRLSVETLKPANATHCYATPEGWEVFAGQAGKKAAAAISKRMRRGRVTIIGTDFYESNESIDELLQKSLRLTR